MQTPDHATIEMQAGRLYFEFWESCGQRTMQGKKALLWSDSRLPEEVREAWRAVARYMMKAVEKAGAKTE
jgi:hypothetical protein